MNPFRQLDGDSPAVAEHSPLTRRQLRERRALDDTPLFYAQAGEYDDGNGMWLYALRIAP